MESGRQRKKFLLIELLIVMAIFPLPEAVSAVISAVRHLTLGGTQTSFLILTVPHHYAASLILGLISTLLPFGAVFLVFYLLYMEGPGVSGIGLDIHRLRHDLSRLLPIFLVAYILPLIGTTLLLPGNMFAGFPVKSMHGDALYLPILIPASVVTAVAEEVIVLGYLIRRLEQLGLGAGWVIAIDTLVRVSYHLYYGPGAIEIAVWGAASAALYMRYRRLGPFIVVHALWDATLFVIDVRAGAVIPIELVVLSVLAAAFWAKWHRLAEPLHSGSVG